jgi:alpha-tubulin suppressor-like RCC1 family protein
MDLNTKGSVVLVPHDMVPTATAAWHAAYCAMKAGATGVIFGSAPGVEPAPLKTEPITVPCVSVSAETGDALAEVVSRQDEPEDMFAPIPLTPGEDETGVVTAGLGLWVRDKLSFASVSVGHEHALALTSSGCVFSWGSSAKGRLGLGSGVTSTQVSPVLVQYGLAGMEVSKVAAGHTFSYAILSTGTLFAWGNNEGPGLLGVGDTIERWEPSEVTTLREYPLVDLSVQHNTTVVICQCSDADAQPEAEPEVELEAEPEAEPETAPEVTSFNGSCGFTWGTLEVCGKGVIRLAERPKPVRLCLPREAADGEKLVSAAAGRHHGLVASSTGSVFSWGRGRSGRLGLGKEKEHLRLITGPVEIASEGFAGAAATRVFAQDDHSFAINSDGQLFSWGCNDFPGKLGLGDTKDRFTPCKVEGLPPLATMSGKLAIDTNGAIWKIEKTSDQYHLMPAGQTVHHANATMGRGAVVSTSGRLWEFSFGKTTTPEEEIVTDESEILWTSSSILPR